MKLAHTSTHDLRFKNRKVVDLKDFIIKANLVLKLDKTRATEKTRRCFEYSITVTVLYHFKLSMQKETDRNNDKSTHLLSSKIFSKPQIQKKYTQWFDPAASQLYF